MSFIPHLSLSSICCYGSPSSSNPSVDVFQQESSFPTIGSSAVCLPANLSGTLEWCNGLTFCFMTKGDRRKAGVVESEASSTMDTTSPHYDDDYEEGVAEKGGKPRGNNERGGGAVAVASRAEGASAAEEEEGEEETRQRQGETEIGGEKIWEAFRQRFLQVQSVLDQNRVLISQVNENHQSRLPDNLSKNVSLIREINSNISKVVSLYADLSNNFSKMYQEQLQKNPKPSSSSSSNNNCHNQP